MVIAWDAGDPEPENMYFPGSNNRAFGLKSSSFATRLPPRILASVEIIGGSYCAFFDYLISFTLLCLL